MLHFRKTYLLCAIFLIEILASMSFILKTDNSERYMHPTIHFKTKHMQKRALPMLNFDSTKPEEYTTDYWNNVGQDILLQQLYSKTQLNTNLAKNLIMFLGDGMSIPTITAGRIYLGGEEKQFSFEKFPFIGLSKTYCANTQVADSACTATAYLTGVKANYATVGISAAVELSDCLGQNNTANHVNSLAAWAQQRGMATGLITTTAVTHASPAGVYAHAANRMWENDAEVLSDKGDPGMCTDIASQLVNGEVGRNLNVVLGGGRIHFLPNTENDITGVPGKRLDGQNLIEQWQTQHGPHAEYVQTKEELLNINSSTTHILGLFADNHMPFHSDANLKQIPTLKEMVDVALNILQKQSPEKGFFLFVEGGRIDHGHHYTMAKKALEETVEFDKAIELATTRSNPNETLIVVTSDHSHTMSIAGYSSRKNDIFGINNGQLGADQLPYSTLSYANGPAFDNYFLKHEGETIRTNLYEMNMQSGETQFPSAVPLAIETHGGDDVAVFARGPFAHLFTGVYEQNFIPHAMNYAACLSGRKTVCSDGLHHRK